VHGDGLDEVTTAGTTLVFEIRGSDVHSFQWTPADFGVEQADIAHLHGGDPARNARIATAVLNGQAGPQRDIVLVNSAAALLVSGLADSPLHAMKRAAQSIDSGAARSKLEKLAEFSRSCPGD